MKIYVHLLLKLLNLLKLHTVSKSAPLSNPAQNNCVLRIFLTSEYWRPQNIYVQIFVSSEYLRPNICALRIIVQSIRQVGIALSGPIFSNLGRQNTNMAIKSLPLYFKVEFSPYTSSFGWLSFLNY